MVYDDIVIGSGLTSLATILGLPKGRKICVLAGLDTPHIQYYDSVSCIPSSNLGRYGLGSYWHGVIPTCDLNAIGPLDINSYSSLFNYFYPGELINDRVNCPWIFIPFQPIRPSNYWRRIRQEKYEDLNFLKVLATSIHEDSRGWRVTTSEGFVFYGSRVWIGAGALGTSKILLNSPQFSGSVRGTASDHLIIYLGQLDRQKYPNQTAPVVSRGRRGVWLKSIYDEVNQALITTKPAYFDYKQLDRGIEQRNAFGLPASGVVGKLFNSRSPGLLFEAAFNKWGFFPNSSKLNVYAQIRVKDGYVIDFDKNQLHPIQGNIENRISQLHSNLEWPELNKTKRKDLFIRGIHLHRTVNRKGCLDFELNKMYPTFSIVDSSIIENIGPEHHTFKTMVHAYMQAKKS
ncbi:hypothetical protein AOC10_01795 [Polynucleobacter asymbioticus]|uniref:hypothetical protein n=1 Tax=Polynucleobacter asymbioticus TaxID=576611 RepID=UPI0008FB2B0D|nr:hypothetical protein [Polynucleobacter asymbioticus]APC05349.1 hypothetical protein AOC10_01795 [Polynucleobacter asymbioticus]